MKNIQKYRLIVQLLFMPLYIVGLFTQFKVTILLIMISAFFIGVYHCGWMCPYGTLQELTGKLGGKLGIKKIKMPVYIQHYLVYVRYVIYVLFMLFTLDILFTMMTYDPRVTTEFLMTGNVVTIGAIIVLTSFLLISLFFDRPFCNYLCIEGAKFGLISLLRPVTIHRHEQTCINCKKCDKVCPMQIEVSTTEYLHSPSCIHCFECMDVCPVNETLTYGSVTVTPKLKKHYTHMLAFAAIIGTCFLFYSIALSNAADTLDSTSTLFKAEAETTDDFSGNIDNQEGSHNGRHNNNNSASQDFSNPEVNLSTEDTPSSIDSDTNASTNNDTISDAMGIADGIYSGVGRGFRGNMTVEVTIAHEMITQVEVVKHVDDYRWFSYAYPIITDRMINEQTVYVDTVSGATYSANGIIKGAIEALESAGN